MKKSVEKIEFEPKNGRTYGLINGKWKIIKVHIPAIWVAKLSFWSCNPEIIGVQGWTKNELKAILSDLPISITSPRKYHPILLIRATGDKRNQWTFAYAQTTLDETWARLIARGAKIITRNGIVEPKNNHIYIESIEGNCQ